jgi:hypothetical protein
VPNSRIQKNSDTKHHNLHTIAKRTHPQQNTESITNTNHGPQQAQGITLHMTIMRTTLDTQPTDLSKQTIATQPHDTNTKTHGITNQT